ncbi:hypothetical protein ACROYT_G020062 [Oculina patagonica]
MKKRCSRLVLLVLLNLFKGDEAGIDGGYSEWSEWSECSKTCGIGVRQRSRTCTNPKPERNGKTCAEQGLGPDKRSIECFFGNCNGTDGGYSEWSEWSECSGSGYETSLKHRSRTCTNPKPEGDGKTCEEQGLGNAEWTTNCYQENSFSIFVFFTWPLFLVTFGLPCILLCVLVSVCYCTFYKKQRPRQSTATSLITREVTEGRHLPSYSEARVQQLHSVPPQQSGSDSEVLQIVNLQSTSHSQAHTGVRLPITRERSVPTASPPELLTVALPPRHSEEEPPPPYSAGEPLPPHSREEPPPAYSEPLSPYAMTSLV